MPKNKSLDHAQHNERVCNYLDKKAEYGDWVITTAFYSALHYLRHKIFPLRFKKEEKQITVKEFESFCTIKAITHGKHAAFSRLVEEKARNVADDYNQLKDISWTARYHDYNYDRAISKLAKKRLNNIKTFCLR